MIKPRIAIGAGGEAVAIWRRFDGNHSFVQVASRPQDSAWSAPTTISASRRRSEASEPQIAISSAGEAVATWGFEDLSKGGYGPRVIQVASRPPAGAWSAPTTISAKNDFAGDSQIGIDDAGEVLVVWRQGIFLEGASRPPGGAWSVPSKLSTKGRIADFPDLAVNAAGEASAVWTSYDSTGNASIIQSASRSPGGVWSTPARISNERSEAVIPQVAVNAAGEAVVVWESERPRVIQSASRPRGGTWSSIQTLSRVPHNPDAFLAPSATEPQIAVNAAGYAVAVWQRSAVVQSASRSPGGAWSKPANISARRLLGFEPQVAIDADGGAVAVWTERPPGSSFIVRGSSRSLEGAWSKPADLSPKGGPGPEPRVVTTPSGEALAIWDRAGYRFSYSRIETSSGP